MPVELRAANRARRAGFPFPPADPPGRQAGLAGQDDRLRGSGEGHPRGDPARMPHRGRRTGQRAIRDDVRAGHVDAARRSGESEPRPQVRRRLACAGAAGQGRSRTSTTTRPSAIHRRPATRCRSTWTRTSPRRRVCPGSSRTACARWRWRRGRCSPRSAGVRCQAAQAVRRALRQDGDARRRPGDQDLEGRRRRTE